MKALIILLLLPLQLLSQDISGIWTGMIHTRGNDLSYELVISENNEELSGYALTVFTINGVENVGVKSVLLKKKKGNISIEDDRLIYNNYTSPSRRIKLLGSLSLTVENSIMTLSGNFRTRLLDLRSSGNSSYTGTITLHKKKNFEKTRLIAQLDTMNLLNTLSFVQPEKEKPFIATVRIERSQLPLLEEKDIVKDSAILTISEPLIVVLEKPKEYQMDSVSKKLTEKNIVAPVVETKINETAAPVALVKEPKRPPPEKEKQVDSIAKNVTEKNIQAPVVKTKIKETSVPVALVKEPERFPEKEKRIDSVSKKVIEKNVPVVVETKSGPPKPVVIKPTEPPVIVDAAAAIAERKTEIIRNVFFTSDTLLLSLYDNGTVDGDTVSVVLNGKIIVAKQRLTENALRVVIQMTPDLGDSLLLTMYAENLGSIPPNTGLLIIQDGEERSQIRFEGDMQKSSAVILRRKH
jgi:hypothetical protein